MGYITRITEKALCLEGQPLFAEGTTTVSIVDEAGGEFIEISQCDDDNEGKIRIDRHEWDHLKLMIESMMTNIQENDTTK